MNIWILCGIIIVAGAIGGIINALLSDNGFLLPRTELTENVRIVRPGAIGNIIIGAAAAIISWGLYGPLSATPLFGPSSPDTTITLGTFVGAILVGTGGARWLTTEVDKKILKIAASIALAKSDGRTPAEVDAATPIEILEFAQELDTDEAQQ